LEKAKPPSTQRRVDGTIGRTIDAGMVEGGCAFSTLLEMPGNAERGQRCPA
jgi:hypothetical protein